MSLSYGHTTKTVRSRTPPCVSSTLPKECFRCTRVVRFFRSPEGVLPSRTPCVSFAFPKDCVRCAWLCGSSTIPKDRFCCTRCVVLPRSRKIASVAHGVWFFHDPERSLPLHTVVWVFHDPEGSLPQHTPVHFFHGSEESLPSHTVVRFFHDSEESFPSHTVARFIHPPEGVLPLRAPCVSSAFPKDRFRHARPPFPSASSSEKHCQCVEKRLPHSLCGPLLSPLSAEANHGSISSPTGSALIGPESNAGTCPFRVPTSCSLFASFTIAEASVSVASSHLPPFSDHLPLVSGSCDPSSFDITANCFWYDPTPVTHSREVDDLHRRSERLVSL
jgi:hypothetical protein